MSGRVRPASNARRRLLPLVVLSLVAGCDSLQRRSAELELRRGADGAADPVAGARVTVAPTYLFVASPEEGAGGPIVPPGPEGAEAGTTGDDGTLRIAVPVSHPARITVYAPGEPVRGLTLDWRGETTDWLLLIGGDPQARPRTWVRLQPGR